MNSTTSNAKRPPRIEKPLRRIVIRGVKSMLTLNPTDKLVYLEILHLDQRQDGCYAGAEIVADRCGLGIRKVEDTRRVLKAGVRREQTSAGLSQRYVVRYAAHTASRCHPEPHRETGTRAA